MSNNKGYTISTAEELKNRKVSQKSRTKSKLAKTALAIALIAGLAVGGHFIATNIDLNESSSIVQVDENVGFNINSKDEIVTRGLDLGLDLREAGYEITGEDALYFMLFAGCDNLNEDFVEKLNLSNVTERVITDSVDKTLIDVKEAIIGGKEVSIADYFPEVEDQELLDQLMGIISDWHKVGQQEAELQNSNKEIIASDMLALNEYMFMKGGYQDYTPQAVVTYIKLFRGFDELTINSGYTLATEDMRNLMYIDQDCYTEEGKIEGRSIHSEQYAVVKEILNEKFNNRDYSKDYESGLGYEIITEIDKKIKESGIELGTKTDVQAERDKYNNTIYADNPASPDYVKPISPSEKEQIKVDKNTGEEYIYQPATEQEKEQQREEINQQIKQEEENAPSAEQISAEIQSGYDEGFQDGVDGKAKDDLSGKSSNYVKGYDMGYSDGYVIYEGSLGEDILVEESYESVIEQPVVENTNNYENNNNNYVENNNNNANNYYEEESTFVPVDGFYTDGNGVVYDSNGNMLTDEYGNPLTIGGSEEDYSRQR